MKLTCIKPTSTLSKYKEYDVTLFRTQLRNSVRDVTYTLDDADMARVKNNKGNHITVSIDRFTTRKFIGKIKNIQITL